MLPILIGLNGYKGSGKNTAAKFIAQWAEARGKHASERAFAELLKLSAARSLGLATNINDAVVLMDSLKESGDIQITIPEQSLQRVITGREFLKWYGTEGHRDVFGGDFWLDLILPVSDHIMHWSYNFLAEDDTVADIAIITDVRFVNEATRIKELGGHIWNIDRGFDAEDHPSEQPLPRHLIDLVIDNRTTLEAFEVEVRSCMTADFHMHFVERPDPLEFEEVTDPEWDRDDSLTDQDVKRGDYPQPRMD